MPRATDLAELLTRLQREYWEGLTPRQNDALEVYTRDGSGFNLDLRGSGIPREELEFDTWFQHVKENLDAEEFVTVEDLYDELDVIIEEAPRLDEPFSVYRRIEDLYSDTLGDVDPAYVSTSTTAQAAYGSGNADNAVLRRLLEIRVDPEESALYVPPHQSFYPKELEVLLPRNRRLAPTQVQPRKFEKVLERENPDKWDEVVRHYRLTKHQGGHVNLGEHQHG